MADGKVFGLRWKPLISRDDCIFKCESPRYLGGIEGVKGYFFKGSSIGSIVHYFHYEVLWENSSNSVIHPAKNEQVRLAGQEVNSF